MTRFSRDGLLIQAGADNVVIAGNWIGTTGTGAVGTGNGDDNIDLRGAFATIGGNSVNDRNVITNAGDEGIDITGAAATGNFVLGNFIGLDPDGSTGSGNGDVGIAVISGASANTIGGSSAASRNVISKNFEGIEISTPNNVVQGNYIGTDVGGTLNRGQRSDDGIEILSGGNGSVIGGTGPGEGNLIAFSFRHGVNIAGGETIAVLGNRIHSNTLRGIDLGNNGVTANDGAKTAGQPNLYMDYPVFTSAALSGTTLTVSGYVGSAPGQSIFANSRVEIFKSDNDPSGYGEGQTYLGFLTTDANGNFSGSLTVSGLAVGDRITATATDTTSNTSEFASNMLVSLSSCPVVNTTADSGAGSLRECIAYANSNPGTTISFNIPGVGPHTIQPGSALPALVAQMTIDGYTQPGAVPNTSPAFGPSNAVLKIELDGSVAGAGVEGLTINAGGCTVKGLVINRFSNNGILINGTNNVITGNWIGLDSGGTLDRGNVVDGIRISSDNNTIGGATAADRNVLSGNDDEGLDIDPGVSGTVVLGNFIGTNPSGNAATPNGLPAALQSGGLLVDGDNTRVGGSVSGEGNLISGNNVSGLRMNGVGNTAQGNRIGTDASGDIALANNGFGVGISGFAGGANNAIGGTGGGEGNIIAFNAGNGVQLEATAGTGNGILGNSIHGNSSLGIDLGNDNVTLNNGTKNAALPNSDMDFPVFTTATLSGTTLAVAGYVGSAPSQSIFANSRVEIFKSDNDPSGYGEGQTYLGFLTTDANGNFSGALTVSGLSSGDAITATATDATNNTSEFGSNMDVSSCPVVTTTADSGAGSLRECIAYANSNPGTTISFNIPGAGPHTIQPGSALPALAAQMTIDGYTQPGAQPNTVPMPGLTDAVLQIQIDGSVAGAGVDGLTITAGSSTVRGLVINRFNGNGILLSLGGGNTIEGNYIGTNFAGTVKLGNGDISGVLGGGIWISSDANVIGGTTPAARNIISGNNNEGINIQNGTPTGNAIRGNFIGTDATGTLALGNFDDGIAVRSDASDTTIDGTAANASNLISGNGGEGIHVSGSNGNIIQGNIIGTDVTGVFDVGNVVNGVLLANGANGNTIGGTGAGESNTIAFNIGDGIYLTDAGTGSNLVSGNSIFSNIGLGIDLDPDGVTLNNGTKNAALPNFDMDFPVFTSANLSGTTLTVAGYVGSAPSQATFADARVEVFKSDDDASGYGEGQTYLGNLTTDANGNFSGSLTVSGLSVGDKITATATDNTNNTSEFGANVTVTDPPTVSFTAASQSGAEDTVGTMTVTARLSAVTGLPVTVPSRDDCGGQPRQHDHDHRGDRHPG